MTLWEFLKHRMTAYGDKTAFGDFTYKRLIEESEKPSPFFNRSSLRIIHTDSQADMLLKILSALANGFTAIPVYSCYGKHNLEEIEMRVSKNKTVYPDVALIMFTSGSTGVPKGVCLSHFNIISNLLAIENYFKVSTEDTFFVSRPLSHIAVLSGEVFLALISGASIEFYNEPLNIKKMYAKINESGATILGGTPTMFNLLSINKGNWGIKKAIISGEVLFADRAKKFALKWSHTDFYSVYGLTEAGPRVSALMPQDFITRAGSVGKPILDTEIEVRGSELYVKSASIMQGYYCDDAATERKLRDGWLKTSDAARLEDGYLYIDGRLDEMIIRSGLNIYPAEVESLIMKLAGVDSCKVWGEPDSLSGQKIKCKVYSKLSRKEILRYINHNLPEHLRPSEISVDPDIETTASGKTVQ